jgi:hypothetical protein
MPSPKSYVTYADFLREEVGPNKAGFSIDDLEAEADQRRPPDEARDSFDELDFSRRR